jgi:hypothetical protein
MRSRVVLVALTLASSAAGFDTRCRLESPDCEGEEAARVSWAHGEHAQLWLDTRVRAGLPAAVDEPFEVVSLTVSSESLLPAPLDLVSAKTTREVEIAAFAQLPDLSYAMWDWAAGNEGCPPTATENFPDCHAFKAHMGWLNSTHFLPQAEEMFFHLHALALERPAHCRTLADAGVDRQYPLACDREALLIEAQAHHYLQDAWSTGHMWQRWGSPEVADFGQSFVAAQSPDQVKVIGDAVGRASGIIHGAKAITGIDDAMCAPAAGVA